MNNCPDKGPGKEGIVEDDKFTMEFAEIDNNKTPYCRIPKDDADRQKICKDNNDGLQFYMTFLSGAEGSATMPYDMSKNNRYAVHTGGNDEMKKPKELAMCQVSVERTANLTPKGKDKGMWVGIQVKRSAKTGGTGDQSYKEIGSFDQQKECSATPNSYTISKRANGLAKDLVVKFKDAGNRQAIDQPIEFEYGDFKWDSDTQGKSKAVSEKYKEAKEYAYCMSSNPKRAHSPEETDQDPMNKVKLGSMTCFFPCYES
ncbi:MAG: hypothetical protein Q9160_003569 [Pyrenula sp. 1 TL-2023]